MNNFNLTDSESGVIKKCLIETIQCSYFDDNEFSTLIGCNRGRVSEIEKNWPAVTNTKENYSIIINCLNNLLGYPHGKNRQLYSFIKTDEKNLDNLLEKLLKQFHNKYPS